MAKRLALLVIFPALLLLLSGSLAVADDNNSRTVGARSVYLGDDYIGCLEMGFSRCFAHPTLICLEDAMVECSLQAAAAAPAPAATAPPAPAAELAALGGAIMRGITNLGASYIECVEVDLAKCLLDPTMACVEGALGAC